jgi:hypothetical protein
MKPTKHLNDEHMRLYEWSGLCAETAAAVPDRSKRTHAWHASYGVLAVLTSLLILYGCDAQGPAAAARDPADRSIPETEDRANPLYEEATDKPGPAEETGQVLRNPIKQT